MKFLYKYPQRKFPYEELVLENARRGKEDREYQLIDTGVFDEDRYWDIFIETAKEGHDEEELLFRVTAYNRGTEPAPLHIVPHVWFRNTWAWGYKNAGKKPTIRQVAPLAAQTWHPKLGERFVQLAPSPGTGPSGEDVQPEMIFTENDTNFEALYGARNTQSYVKDAFHRYVVKGEKGAINPDHRGTKVSLMTSPCYCSEAHHTSRSLRSERSLVRFHRRSGSTPRRVCRCSSSIVEKIRRIPG